MACKNLQAFLFVSFQHGWHSSKTKEMKIDASEILVAVYSVGNKYLPQGQNLS
jgi:hypothetical protein